MSLVSAYISERTEIHNQWRYKNWIIKLGNALSLYLTCFGGIKVNASKLPVVSAWDVAHDNTSRTVCQKPNNAVDHHVTEGQRSQHVGNQLQEIMKLQAVDFQFANDQAIIDNGPVVRNTMDPTPTTIRQCDLEPPGVSCRGRLVDHTTEKEKQRNQNRKLPNSA